MKLLIPSLGMGLGALLFALSSERIVAFIGMVLLFSAFDVLGYKFVGGEGNVFAYRILQTVFQVMLVLLAWRMFGIKTSIAFVLSWWLLTCDVLFYWLLGMKVDDFTWFNFSPVVFLYRTVLGLPSAPADAVIVSGVLGLVLGLSILL